MPIATPEIYAQMLDRAKQQGFAYPAINVTSSQTLNAALRGFADAESDGIIQASTGGAEYLSGASVKDMVVGAEALAEFAKVVAARYPVHVALHTDHCPKGKLDSYMRPLIQISAERVKNGQEPLFQSHMWDGSAVPLPENLEIARELLDQCAKARIIMEAEIGVVGGEEDGIVGEMNEKLYTTPEDALATAEALGLGERGCTSSPRRSATSTASTSPDTSSSGPRCSRRSRRRWVPSTARTSRSTWSSTGARGRRSRRSARPSPTVS
jgi:fructose-bisphosphate aldolase class II